MAPPRLVVGEEWSVDTGTAAVKVTGKYSHLVGTKGGSTTGRGQRDGTMTDAARPGAQAEGPAPAGERPVKVLLVDDQAIVGESIRRMLAAEADIQLHFCQDPARAIETANAFGPTVILQDLVMPDIDGLLLVKFFRANPATRDIPMIVLSSKEEPVIKAQAFAL